MEKITVTNAAQFDRVLRGKTLYVAAPSYVGETDVVYLAVNKEYIKGLLLVKHDKMKITLNVGQILAYVSHIERRAKDASPIKMAHNS